MRQPCLPPSLCTAGSNFLFDITQQAPPAYLPQLNSALVGNLLLLALVPPIQYACNTGLLSPYKLLPLLVQYVPSSEAVPPLNPALCIQKTHSTQAMCHPEP